MPTAGDRADENPNPLSETSDLAFRFLDAMKRAAAGDPVEGLDVTRSTPEDLILGRVALEAGKITAVQLREALHEQSRAAGRGERISLETWLLSRNLLSVEAVAALKAPPPVQPPEPVPSPSRYELQNLVGQGATAMVYRAWDRELKRPVALKMLRETAAMSETARARSGDADRAEAATRRAIEIDPEFAPARYQLGRLLLARSYGLLLGADPDERKARNPEAERLAREAAEEIERALTSGRGFEDPLHRGIAQGMLAQAGGRPARARELARAGLEKFPNQEGREEFHWLAGLTLTGAEQLDEFTRALEIRPKWPLVLLARAGARVVRGDAAGAMADCDEILRLRANDGPALLNRAIALFRLGRLEEALRDFDRAVAAAPDDAMCRYNRGVTRLRQGDVDGAFADFEETLKKRPSFAPALNNRGSVRLRRGDLDGAIRDFDAALQQKKEFADARTNRGSARRRKGDLDGALADFDEALRLDPRSAEALYNRALVWLKKDDLRSMLQDLDRAIEVHPAWNEPYVARAQLRRVLGDRAGAREDARRALGLGVGAEDRAALEELLKSDE